MITSLHNKFIKQAAGLKLRKQRDSTGLFVIEGEKFIKEIPDDWEIKGFIISDSFASDLSWYNQRAELRCVSERVFMSLSDTVSPQGVLAVAKRKEYDPQLPYKFERPFMLICECIQDPGNLGTLLRTADASGCDCVILSKGCADAFGPKTLRAAAGAVFHVPIFERVDLADMILQLMQGGINVVATQPIGGKPVYETELTGACAVLIGNEGRGISDEILKLVKTHVSIPMPGRAESLNASIAAAMLMYEAVRQRLP